MKIIYDTEKPSSRRVQVINGDGEVFNIQSFHIKIDDGNNSVFDAKRWGSASERRKRAIEYARLETK